MKYIANKLGKIPPIIFHTWQVISLLCDEDNFTIAPIPIITKSLGITINNCYKRIRDTLAFKTEGEHILYRCIVYRIESNNQVSYEAGDIIEVNQEGKFEHPTDQYNNKLPLGFIVKPIEELI